VLTVDNEHIASGHPGHHEPYAGESEAARLMAYIAEHRVFQLFIVTTIILAGAVVGMETYREFAQANQLLIALLNRIIVGIFVVEIVVKMAGQGRKPWRYFRDPWNVFDFSIVAASLLPFAGEGIVLLRLIRLLRVLKLVTALPRLQILVSALIRSIPSMGYVSILLFLLFYIYAVAAVFLFGENDPLLFGNLHTSLLSLFRVVTLEDWTDVMYTAMYGCANYAMAMNQDELCTASQGRPLLGALFFVSFVLIGTMVMLNLFIGVIMNSMNEARADLEKEVRFLQSQGSGGTVPTLQQELAELSEQLLLLQDKLVLAGKRAGEAAPPKASPQASIPLTPSGPGD
jgi:voltage-gated sodium channel